MLHHVIQHHDKDWQKFVCLMLWALREVPNATTGVSPYKLVYMRNPSGPLTILKEYWAGQNTTSTSLVQPIEEYLVDLRSKLSEATDFAKNHFDAAQQSYTAHYNFRSHQKRFQKGDQVIVYRQRTRTTCVIVG